MKLLHIKTLCNWSDKSFDLMIDLIMQALLNGESLPNRIMKQSSLGETWVLAMS